jgi:DNA (cytosine-5)-methyltransferase 1
MNGLDLFSGIGGLSLALSPWVRPVAYCEVDAYAQGVLLSRMSAGELPAAPIWDDVRTLRGVHLPTRTHIIYGGFPCQDISVAGAGAGLDGERSGLFFEIVRLAEEIKPEYIFLENVPAIRTRGLDTVVKTLACLGYDCRWTTLSAEDVGAPHLRKRWWLLAKRADSRGDVVRLESGRGLPTRPAAPPRSGEHGSPRPMAHTHDAGLEGRYSAGLPERTGELAFGARDSSRAGNLSRSWWETEPDVGRVADGVLARVDRLKALGNAVVPLQARTAFQMLMGLL